MKVVLLYILVICSSCSALAAGGWNSGGGGLIDDTLNPWFLPNTKAVSYCIEIDEAKMGFSRKFVEPLVLRALDFWRGQFALAPDGDNHIRIATQTFVKTELCGDRTDLKFQFGVLSRIQAKAIQEPTRFVSFASREHYDRQSLRGSGFIYFSPERGPLAIRKNYLPQLPWSATQGLAIYPVLLHELGHIFGLSHDSGDGLMNDGFPELLLSLPKSDHKFALDLLNVLFAKNDPDFIGFRNTSPLFEKFCVRSVSESNTTLPTLFERYFGLLGGGGTCSYALLKNVTELEIVQSSGDGVETVTGTAHLRKLPESSVWRPVVKVFLPRGQKVFPTEAKNILMGAQAEVETLMVGEYVSDDQKIHRKVGVRVAPWGVPVLTGVLDGSLILDLNSEASVQK